MSDHTPGAGLCPVSGHPDSSAADPSHATTERPTDRPADRPADPYRQRKLAPAATLLKGKGSLLGLQRTSRGNVLKVIPYGTTHEKVLSGKMFRRFHFLTDPDGLRRVFKSNFINYPKSAETKGVLEKALKRGLFVIEGEEWRWQRRALNPAFAPRNVARLTPQMTRAAVEAADRLAGQEEVDISFEMMSAAFNVIVWVTFGENEAGEAAVPLDVVNAAVDQYLSSTAKSSILDFLGVPTWVPRPGRLRTHPTLKAMKTACDRAIAERRANRSGEATNFLDMLLDAEDPKTGRRMTDAQLRDNLITFLIAGHETTALTLTWALYLLALDPETQDRAAAEATEVLGDRAATGADVPKLSYIIQVIQETLRLYPPIPVHLRTAGAPDSLCDHAIEQGDIVIVPFYSLHRHHKLWDRPGRFAPERFDDMSKIDRFAYVPFSTGPRVCIGADFAMQESAIILATLLARFRFSLTDRPAPEPTLILTLRPDKDIWLGVRPRAKGERA